MTPAGHCGHEWRGEFRDHTVDREPQTFSPDHLCVVPANHPNPCRCRCGATTTRPAEGEQR